MNESRPRKAKEEEGFEEKRREYICKSFQSYVIQGRVLDWGIGTKV